MYVACKVVKAQASNQVRNARRIAKLEDVILESGPRWNELLGKVNASETKVEQLTKILNGALDTALATDRAVMGGWNADRTQWIPGVRDDIKDLRENIVEARNEAKGLRSIGKWAVSVVTAIFIGLLVETANNAFGWWGTAHAAAATAKILAGGH